MNTETTYGSVAKFLHWTIAIAILGMIALGYYMGDLPNDPFKFQLFQLHKSIGLTILFLSLFRLYWRLRHPAPPLPATMKAWEIISARLVMIAFYALMIGIPFVGWAMVSASPRNIPTIFYGLFQWPHLPILPDLENKKQIAHLMGELHALLAYSVLALLVLHVGGALKHHFVTRDDVMTRMMPKVFNGFLIRLRGK